MQSDFEELDNRNTPYGELSLRRRRLPALVDEVFEVKLGDEFLMSSLFTAGEIALADLALAVAANGPIDVVVGGLGLGYTAQAALRDSRVRMLDVIEAMPAVIDWHRRSLVPLGASLCADGRCRFINADFFSLIDSPGIDSGDPARRYDAILVDIDHSPQDLLHRASRDFYREQGMRRLAGHLRANGVFGLWSDAPPDPAFEAVVLTAFRTCASHVVRFAHPLHEREASNTVYVATGPRIGQN